MQTGQDRPSVVARMKMGIGLGANLGDRVGAVKAAIDWLRVLDPEARLSGLYESEPEDCPEGSPRFVNAAAEIEFEDRPEVLLERMQNVEREMGRPEVRGRNAPRPLDMDLLYAEDTIMVSEHLILPHPRMVERVFVLQPLVEICPERVIPGTGRTVAMVLAGLLERGGKLCRRIE
ncbi:MAG: 2-amino-4-hydroxy-6-hydroxymethyldihydropteridine diphosphokinase [Candidatus Methylacidiphilales bacterium]